MKSFQAILLSVILLIFLLLLGVSVFFTHEASFKKISNLLLAPLAIEISKVEDINLSLSERSLSVNNIYLHYQGNIAHLHQATFYLGYLSYLGNLNEGEKHHKITLKQLSVEINSTSSSENSQQKTTNLLDLLPEKIIQDYAGVDVLLETLTIHHTS